MRQISEAGKKLIQEFESCARIGEDGWVYPYLDAVGVPTIGWGSTFWKNGNPVEMSDSAISQKDADDLFLYTLKNYVDGVNRLVTAEINQPQFDALVSFAYNEGCEALHQSTLLKKLNINPNDPTIRDEFAKWVMATGPDGNLVTLPGLVIRRKREAEIYFS